MISILSPWIQHFVYVVCALACAGINDGWLDNLDFESFYDINDLIPSDLLDNRSNDFLNSFKEYQRNKLFPIGVIPYAVIIKNNRDIIKNAKNSWSCKIWD